MSVLFIHWLTCTDNQMFTPLIGTAHLFYPGTNVAGQCCSPWAEDQRQRMSIKWVFGGDTTYSWHTVNHLSVRMLFCLPPLFCFPSASCFSDTNGRQKYWMDLTDYQVTYFSTYVLSQFNVGKEWGPHTETCLRSAECTECTNAWAGGQTAVLQDAGIKCTLTRLPGSCWQTSCFSSLPWLCAVSLVKLGSELGDEWKMTH